MKITRRLFAFLLLSSAFIAFEFASATPKAPAGSHHLAFVGTYTGKTGSKGIYAFDFDSSTGTLSPKGLAAETPSPSWVAIHPSGKFAYAANETGKDSTVTAFSLDSKTAKLTQLNQMSALGAGSLLSILRQNWQISFRRELFLRQRGRFSHSSRR